MPSSRTPRVTGGIVDESIGRSHPCRDAVGGRAVLDEPAGRALHRSVLAVRASDQDLWRHLPEHRAGRPAALVDRVAKAELFEEVEHLPSVAVVCRVSTVGLLAVARSEEFFGPMDELLCELRLLHVTEAGHLHERAHAGISTSEGIMLR